jgi:hypothetical protein
VTPYPMVTVVRPLAAGRPAPPGSTPASCPYCGRPVWRLDLEDTLPAGYAVGACADCALRRGSHQREMDAERAAREARLN